MAFLEKLNFFNIIQGIIQILTSWLIVGWIWAIVDGILCVQKSEEQQSIHITLKKVYLPNNNH